MKNVIFLFFITLTLFSCSSGKKAYEQGDYYEAVTKAVNRLRQKPNHKKSREALKKAYPLAVQTFESDANQALQGHHPMKSKHALRIYERLNYLHDDIRRSPGALKVIPNPNNYFNKINELRPLAAGEVYNEGLKLLDRQSREAAKEAYYHFLEANELSPGYEYVANKIEQAMFDATLKVLVQQIPTPGQYQLSSNFFQDKVEEYLHTRFRSNPFVRFYTP